MRKEYWPYFVLVGGLVCSIYGGYMLIYHFNKGNGLNTPSLILLIVGAIALVFYFTLSLIDIVYKLKHPKTQSKEVEIEKEEAQEEKVEEVKKVEVPSKIVETKKVNREYNPSRDNSYSVYDSSPSTIYVKQVGYGPLFRVTGSQILDMRTNTYYRIEGNYVNQDGYGPLYEIRGNQIKDVFGPYLYEISGSNINKTFGGYYASISGNYITLYDLSIKYEMSEPLSKKQLLAIVALLFGRY